MCYRKSVWKDKIGTCLLGTRRYNLWPCTPPTLTATMHSITDKRTDGRHDDANSRRCSVEVRSAKNHSSSANYATSRSLGRPRVLTKLRLRYMYNGTGTQPNFSVTRFSYQLLGGELGSCAMSINKVFTARQHSLLCRALYWL